MFCELVDWFFYDNEINLTWVDNLNLAFPILMQQRNAAPVLTLSNKSIAPSLLSWAIKNVKKPRFEFFQRPLLCCHKIFSGITTCGEKK